MEFGLRHAHDVHTQVSVQLLAAREPARELIADELASWSQAGQRNGILPLMNDSDACGDDVRVCRG